MSKRRRTLKKYGKTIAKLRKEKGLTQEQLGKKLNISYQAISKWENDLSEPSLDTLENLSKVFGITLTEFFEIANGSKIVNKNSNETVKEELVNIKTNFLQSKPWYFIAALSAIVVVLTLCAFLIPVKYSSSKIYKMVDPSVFCITAQTPTEKLAGSGFFINDSGLAVTNYHVIKNSTSGEVQLNNGKTYKIKSIVGCDENLDVAIIQIDIKHSQSVRLGDSNKISVGDTVYAIGYPESFELGSANSTFTQGIISKTSYTYEGNNYIQTTVDMTHGNSGGVLVNEEGKVIGITTLMLTDGMVDYMNMAIPINKIRDIKRDINLPLKEYSENFIDVYIYDGNSALLEIEEIYKGKHLENYIKTGFIFGGYYLDSSFIEPFDVNQPIEESISLYVKLTPITYTITFDANGGFGSMEKQEFTYSIGQNLNKCLFKKSGYMFKNWIYNGQTFTDEEFVNNLTSDDKNEIVLKAQWDVLIYTVVFDGNGANNTTMDNLLIKYNEKANLLLNEYEKAGYEFLGWSYNGSTFSDGQEVFNLTDTERTITFYAIWSPIDFTVVYYLDGGVNNVANIETYSVLSEPFTLFEATKYGFTFEGWYDSEYYSNRVDKILPTMCRNLTLYAKFSATKYNINYQLDGGQLTLSEEDKYYTILDRHNIDVTPTKNYYTFDGWYDNADFTGEKVTSIPKGNVGEVTLYARYTPIDYTITYVLNGGTVSSPNITTYNFETESYKVTNPEKPGCEFVGWYTDDINRKYSSYTIVKGSHGDIKLTAVYKILEDENGTVLITTPQAFSELTTNNEYWTKNISLENDIDMQGHLLTSSIGLNNHYTGYEFTGTFEGNNHIISNLSTESRNSLRDGSSGIFGNINSATIKNVSFVNVNLEFNTSRGEDIGALIGHALNSTIENCHIQGILNARHSYYYSFSIGGFIGNPVSTKISKCSADLTMFVEVCASSYLEDLELSLSGFSGSGGTIENCYSRTSMNVNLSDQYYYAPDLVKSYIAGFSANSDVKNCYSESEITINAEYTIEQLDVVAFAYNSTVQDCFAICSVNYNQIRDRQALVTYYTFVNEIYDNFENCYYAETNDVVGIDDVQTNGISASANTIYEYCMSNWDNAIWNLYTDKSPTLIGEQNEKNN